MPGKSNASMRACSECRQSWDASLFHVKFASPPHQRLVGAPRQPGVSCLCLSSLQPAACSQHVDSELRRQGCTERPSPLASTPAHPAPPRPAPARQTTLPLPCPSPTLSPTPSLSPSPHPSPVPSHTRPPPPAATRRSTFLGSGSYAAHWTGDTNAEWQDMRMSISTILNNGLAGCVPSSLA